MGCCPKRKPRCPRPKPRCRKPKPRCRKPKPRCARPKPRCRKPLHMKPGPVTNNGYLNFLRYFRRKRCNLTPREAIIQGARVWCALPQCKKDRFNRMACRVSHSKRMKCSALCREAACIRRKRNAAKRRKC